MGEWLKQIPSKHDPRVIARLRELKALHPTCAGISTLIRFMVEKWLAMYDAGMVRLTTEDLEAYTAWNTQRVFEFPEAVAAPGEARCPGPKPPSKAYSAPTRLTATHRMAVLDAVDGAVGIVSWNRPPFFRFSFANKFSRSAA